MKTALLVSSVEDRALKERVRDRLVEKGLHVETSELGGEVDPHETRGRLVAADVAVFVLTESSLKSDWMLRQLGAAWALGKRLVVVADDPKLIDNVGLDLSSGTSVVLRSNQLSQGFPIDLNRTAPALPIRPPATTSKEVQRAASLETGWWPRFRAWLFGYDVFISYRHQDGLAYAMALQNRLVAKDLAVFRDVHELPTGVPLQEAIDKALRRSRMLVVVASLRARDEQSWVARELRTFPTGRPVVAIHFDEEVKAWKPLAEVERKWVAETSRLSSPQPSDDVVASILGARRFARVTASARRVVGAAGLTLFVVASLFGIQTVRQGRDQARADAEAYARAQQAVALAALNAATANSDRASLYQSIDRFVGTGPSEQSSIAPEPREGFDLPTSPFAAVTFSREAALALASVSGGRLGPAYSPLRRALDLVGGYPSECKGTPGTAAIAIAGPNRVAAVDGDRSIAECDGSDIRRFTADALLASIAYTKGNSPRLRASLSDGRVLEWNASGQATYLCADAVSDNAGAQLSTDGELLLRFNKAGRLTASRVANRCVDEVAVSHGRAAPRNQFADDGIACAAFDDRQVGCTTGESFVIATLAQGDTAIGVSCSRGECQVVVSGACTGIVESCTALVSLTPDPAQTAPADWGVVHGRIATSHVVRTPLRMIDGTVAAGGDWLVVGDDLGAVRWWSTSDSAQFGPPRFGHETKIAAIRQRGSDVVTLDDTGELRVWPDRGEDAKLKVATGSSAVECARFSRDGTWLGVVAWREFGTGQYFESVRSGVPAVPSLCGEAGDFVDMPSRRPRPGVLSAKREGRVVHLITPSGPTDLYGLGARITGFDVSPDGRLAAATAADGTVAVWQLPDGTAPLELQVNDERGASFVAFSPDSKAIVTWGVDGAASYHVVDPQSLLELAKQRGRDITEAERTTYQVR